MTIKELCKQLKVGRKLKLSYTGFLGMAEGAVVTEDLVVFKNRRIRRQWEEPGKEIIFETDKGDYMTLTLRNSDAPNITELNNGFQISFPPGMLGGGTNTYTWQD